MGVHHEFRIEGLNCVNCAEKIEARISGIECLKEIKLNFAAKKLSFDYEGDSNGLLLKLNKIAGEIEPGVIFIPKNENDSGREYAGHHATKGRFDYLFSAAGIFLFAAALVLNLPDIVTLLLYIAAYLIIGWRVLFTSVKNIISGEIFDENFLMSAATLGALAIGEYPEAVAVMAFYRIGMFFEDSAVEKSRNLISDLMDIRPDFANLKKGGDIVKVYPQEVLPGNIIVVKPGEKVPLDGTVIEGSSALDVSALTGESVPRDVFAGSAVLSGSVNKNGLLHIEVSKSFSRSTVSKILELVENASANKSKTEKFISKFAKVYTPAVIFCAVALAVLPPLLISGAVFSDWIYRSLVFLVVSCPCALVISIPLSFFGGIGGASKNGILIKGGNYLEALNGADTFVFDKTGTLTKGIFKVSKIIAEKSFSNEELLKIAAYAESYSNHPIAVSVREYYGKEIDKTKIDSYTEHAGLGISAGVSGKKVLAGNRKLLDDASVTYNACNETGTLIYIAVDGIFAGCIVISDEIKPDSKKTIQYLIEAGINKIVMLTGDTKEAADKIAAELGITEVYPQLLPHQKIEKTEEIKRSKSAKGRLVFIGDGINDAPVIAGADIGIAMGGLGSDAAIEAADIVLMTDEPSKIITVLKIANKTKIIVWQNICFAMGVKAAVLALGAAGIASMWEAVFADVGVTLIAVLNSMRAMKIQK